MRNWRRGQQTGHWRTGAEALELLETTNTGHTVTVLLMVTDTSYELVTGPIQRITEGGQPGLWVGHHLVAVASPTPAFTAVPSLAAARLGAVAPATLVA